MKEFINATLPIYAIQIIYLLESFLEKLTYNDIPEWDLQLCHKTLMSELEEGFNISIDTDDIIDFSSFKKGIQILRV